jgi:hypothetical protein
MKMDIVANSGNDEFYTPRYAITPIIKYLKAKDFKKIWCPFDTEDSIFVEVLTWEGFCVNFTHIQNGEDFFNIKNLNCDCVVSNPPYSRKGEVIDRLFGLKVPFAMLVGVVGLFESQKRFSMFQSNEFEILYFNKRISYLKDYLDSKPLINPPFSSVYICSGVLPKQICFERLDK